MKQEAEQKGLLVFIVIRSDLSCLFLADELKDKASDKVDEAKDKVAEVTADAQAKGEGK